MKKGYLYVATGEDYIAEATVSVKSLRKHDPSIHSTLITEKPIVNDAFDNIKIMEKKLVYKNKRKEGFMYKVQGIRATPYERTFFVDTDTYFCDCCDELFELLDYYDLLIAPAPADITPVVIGGKPIKGYITYNTGIILFKKNDLLTKFLSDWQRLFEEKYTHCQPPFMDALLHNRIHLYALQPIYNFRLPFFVALPRLKVKIIHGRSDDFVRTESLINQRMVHRGWDPVAERMLYHKVSLGERMRADWKYFKKSIWNWMTQGKKSSP